MTDLESPKRNNDCYFYYYSTCAKGDNCTFRHEPSALGCETTCSFWKEGKCLNIHCNFRHMELRKNRKAIPCYWESQPMGCLKAFCPFLHQNPRPTDGISLEPNGAPETPVSDNTISNNINQQSERKVTAIDSLVVDFEEESDNESAPSFSPMKSGNRIVKVKTLEEIKLEKIQAESAAYYSYCDSDPVVQISDNGDDLRKRIVHRMVTKSVPPERKVQVHKIFRPNIAGVPRSNKRLSDSELATILGDESLRKKRKIVYQNEDGNFKVVLNKKENRMLLTMNDDNVDENIMKQQSEEKYEKVENIKIKTLAELRAERNSKVCGYISEIQAKQEKEEAEVSSTSTDENYENLSVEKSVKHVQEIGPKKKIKLRRKLPIAEETVNESGFISSDDPLLNNTDHSFISQEEENKILEDEDESDKDKTKQDSINRILDEGLLLEGDDDYDDMLKAEEELLNEIDDFLD